MSNKTLWSSWIAAGVVGTAVVSAMAYVGYKAFKNIEKLELDDIFSDMNEQFFHSIRPKNPEGD